MRVGNDPAGLAHGIPPGSVSPLDGYACPACGREPATRAEAPQQRDDLAIVWLHLDGDRLTGTRRCPASRAEQSGEGYAGLFRSRGGPLRRGLGLRGAGRNQMAKCGLSETRGRPATATMSLRAWQSAMTTNRDASRAASVRLRP